MAATAGGSDIQNWGRMAAVRGGEIVDVSLEETTKPHRPVPASWIEAGHTVA